MNKNTNSADVRRLTRATRKAGKSLVRMNFLEMTGIPPHWLRGRALGIVILFRIKQSTWDGHPMFPPYFLSKKDYHGSLIGLLWN